MNLIPRIIRTGFVNNRLSQVLTRTSVITVLDKKYYTNLSHSCKPKVKIVHSPLITTVLWSSHAEPLTLKFIEERVLLVLKLYDKINPEKVTLDSHFFNELGLDSLDHVEVIIAMEDEFGFEFSEQHSERFMRPRDFVRYVADRSDVYE